MFLVFNKDKIMSYIVTLFTILVLFLTASTFSTEKVVETSTNISRLLPIYSVSTNEPKVAITINCAWNADDIDTILETLKNQEVKVTFFMVGDWVEKNEEAVKKIHEAGHEIGNHSYNHPHVNNLGLDKNKEQIQKCSDLIKNITGKGTNLYRGPYGEYNNTVIEAAKELQHQTIQWSIDTLDYKGLTRWPNVGENRAKPWKREHNINAQWHRKHSLKPKWYNYENKRERVQNSYSIRINLYRQLHNR